MTCQAGIPKAMDGKIVHQSGHVVDIMAALVRMSTATYPAEYNGNKITNMQNVNFFPLWKGETVKRNEPIFWEHENNYALRDGKWKLLKEAGDESFQL